MALACTVIPNCCQHKNPYFGFVALGISVKESCGPVDLWFLKHQGFFFFLFAGIQGLGVTGVQLQSCRAQTGVATATQSFCLNAFAHALKPETYHSKAQVKVFDTSLSEELLLCIRKMKLTREQARCREHSGEATFGLVTRGKTPNSFATVLCAHHDD